MTIHKDALIARRAYEIWEHAGRPHGLDREHWLQAATEIEETVTVVVNGDAPAIRFAEIARRNRGRAARRFLDREPEGDEIAERLEHGQGAPGERPIGKPDAVSTLPHVRAAEMVVAVGQSRHGGGIAHGV